MSSKEQLAKLAAAQPIVLQRAQDPAQRYRGVLIGVVSDDLVLVQVEGQAPIDVNEKVIVRMVEAGKAYGFETVISHMISEPVPMVFLALPAGVEVVNLRKAERMDVFVPVDVRHEAEKGGSAADTRILQGYLTNISSGGCRVLTKMPIAAKDVVNLSFHMPLDKHLYTLSGTVLESTSQRSIFGHRVRFFPSDRNVQDLAELRRWINQNMDFTDLFQ